MKLLVVEDDPDMGGLVQRGLAAEGYDVTLMTNGVDALIALRDDTYSAAAIDVMLPGMSGFELCRHIRDSGTAMPILLLTARDAIEDRVHGLDSGADDYLTKPFAFAELAARVRALLRREPTGMRPQIIVGRLTIDSHEHQALVSGHEMPLSRREFTLLRLFATNPDKTLSRTDILESVWGTTENIGTNVIDQYVSYLRKKLDVAGAGLSIVTERGRGYRLDAKNALEPKPSGGSAAGAAPEAAAP
ncbi:two-component system regulatory protein [Leifsonia xyli subsp. cynodontis DSM 46306]|uniref:DNA-binding response regulator n=1 Tax=Leifsonia xyli subsp. cynodontis DSM 46306 TaxID=1389489 RepID=U3PCN2_LEIXC|nr:response regulator transcription factor [Leifsonia xyli]AGW42522.1 two-component system regulatory protein [Leifsonia xyli subsp. cynodontis DSM 46306]